MEIIQICKYVKNYSTIEKIQEKYEVIYLVNMISNDIILNITHIQSQNNYSVKCLCKNISELEAKNIMLFMFENSIGVDGFLDVLQDLSVSYTEVR